MGFTVKSAKNMGLTGSGRITGEIRRALRCCGNRRAKAPKWGKAHTGRTKGVAWGGRGNWRWSSGGWFYWTGRKNAIKGWRLPGWSGGGRPANSSRAT